MWHLIEDERVQQLDFFEPLRWVGFSGRQVFSDSDVFYSTMQSVVSAAATQASSADSKGLVINDTLRIVHVVFPIIVVDGLIFQAVSEGGEMKISRVNAMVVRWRGSPVRKQAAFVTVVNSAYLKEYVSNIQTQAEALLYRLKQVAADAMKAVHSRQWQDAAVQPSAHAALIVPSLLIAAAGEPPR